MTPEILTLDGGERIMYRAVVPEDKDLLRQGFETLSRQTLYQRFAMPKRRLTDAELAFYTELDGVTHFAVAAGLIDDDDIAIEGIGVARYVSLPDEPGTAEIAIVVVDRFQNRGIGTRLFKLVLLEAKQNGLEQMRAHVQRTNRTAMLLVEKCVDQFDVALDGSNRIFSWAL